MGLNKADLSIEEPRFSYLGGWHANLIYIDRRKCVLFTNDRTLFNFLVPDVTRLVIRKLDELFRGFLACVLSEEGLDQEVKEKILEEYREIAYSNTNNKSVLGSMTDLAYHYKYYILSDGSIHGCDLPGIIKKQNHMPMSAIAYRYPIEELKALYGVKS